MSGSTVIPLSLRILSPCNTNVHSKMWYPLVNVNSAFVPLRHAEWTLSCSLCMYIIGLGLSFSNKPALMALIKPLSRRIGQPHMTHTHRCGIRSVSYQDHIEQSLSYRLLCGSYRRALTFGVVGPFAASTTYWQLSLLAFSEVMTLPMAAGTSTSHVSYSTDSLSIASPTKHQLNSMPWPWSPDMTDKDTAREWIG